MGARGSMRAIYKDPANNGSWTGNSPRQILVKLKQILFPCHKPPEGYIRLFFLLSFPQSFQIVAEYLIISLSSRDSLDISITSPTFRKWDHNLS